MKLFIVQLIIFSTNFKYISFSWFESVHHCRFLGNVLAVRISKGFFGLWKNMSYYLRCEPVGLRRVVINMAAHFW